MAVRDQARRRVVENEYRADLERYNGELTLTEANRLLTNDWQRIRKFQSVQNLSGESGTARAMILDSRWNNADPLIKRLLPRDMVEDTLITGYFEFGQAAELLYAEKLPTVRMWMRWNNYVVGGVPDGVTDDYIYEFKATTRPDRDLETIRNETVRQAELYAYVFRRPTLKVQIAQFRVADRPFPLKARDLPKPDIVTITKDAREQDALTILSEFDRGLSGTDLRLATNCKFCGMAVAPTVVFCPNCGKARI